MTERISDGKQSCTFSEIDLIFQLIDLTATAVALYYGALDRYTRITDDSGACCFSIKPLHHNLLL